MTPKQSALVLAALWLCVATLLCIRDLGWFIECRRIQGWTAAAATVEQSRVSDWKDVGPEGRGGTRGRVSVSYRYFAGGQELIGNIATVSGPFEVPRPQTDQYLRDYAPGRRITVYFDPANPDRCIIQRPDASFVACFSCTGAFLGISIAGVLVMFLNVWLAPRPGKYRNYFGYDPRDDPPSRGGTGCP